MTISELKTSMDRRFDGLQRTKADKSDLQRLRKEMLGLRKEMLDSRAGLRHEIVRSAEETRRHFDVVAESLRDDLRLFAEAIAAHSDRLDRHDTRISRLESRSQ